MPEVKSESIKSWESGQPTVGNFRGQNLWEKPSQTNVLEFGFRNPPSRSNRDLRCTVDILYTIVHHMLLPFFSSWLLMTPMTKHGPWVIPSSWGHCHCHWDGLLGLFLRMLPDQGDTWKRGVWFFPTSHEQWLFTTPGWVCFCKCARV